MAGATTNGNIAFYLAQEDEPARRGTRGWWRRLAADALYYGLVAVGAANVIAGCGALGYYLAPLP